MKPGESVRFACGDCGIVFDLCVAPVAEWPEWMDDPPNMFVPSLCSFCGAAELRSVHDTAVNVPRR